MGELFRKMLEESLLKCLCKKVFINIDIKFCFIHYFSHYILLAINPLMTTLILCMYNKSPTHVCYYQYGLGNVFCLLDTSIYSRWGYSYHAQIEQTLIEEIS